MAHLEPDENDVPHTHYHGDYALVEVVRILAYSGLAVLVIFLVWRFLQLRGII